MTLTVGKTAVLLLQVCLLTKLLPHLEENQIFRVKKAVYEFLRVGARGRNGATPLHLACSRESSSVGRYPICVFPSIDVIGLLIECGADPNGRDFDLNTALHVAATASAKPSKATLVQTLLECGVHLDSVNRDGKAFSDVLRSQPVHELVNVAKFTSLQCLAAKAVQKHAIPYRNKLPATLSDFVDLH